MRFGRQQAQVALTDVDERLRRLAAGWAPTPAIPPESRAPIEPALPLRADHWGRRSWRAFVILLGGITLIGAWAWWQGQPREIAPVPSAIPASALASGAPAPLAGGEVVVHVTGAVRKPGLVSLPTGSRVADAIEKAGGARSPRYLDSVNLARVLVDGEQIVLGSAAASASAGGKLSLNSASAAELEQLPGVGPVLAERIVSWRSAHGPFRTVDDLDGVSGVGASLMEQLRPLVIP